MDRSHALSTTNGEPKRIAMPVVSYETDHPVKEYIDACRQHLWLIAVTATSFAMIAAAWSLLQTPIYQARATIGIESPASGALDKDKNYLDNSPEYFQTHFELLKGHQLLRRTADLLKLAHRPEYQPHPSLIQRMLPSWIDAL